jgi:hypothetical protein
MSKLTVIDNTPPFVPIFWAAWDGDPSVRQMNVTQEGVYFRLIKHQWVYDYLPADPWQFAKVLHIDYRTGKRWLDNFHKLLIFTEECEDCHRKSTVKYQQADSECVVNSHRTSVSCHNEKLRNLKNDVKSKAPLRTREKEQNRIEEKKEKQPASSPASQPSTGPKLAPRYTPSIEPAPRKEPDPETYDPRTFCEEITSLLKKGNNVYGEGNVYSAKEVRSALEWALNVEPNGFWVEKVRTLNGLRKCLPTIIKQMGDYEPAPPEVMVPVRKTDPSCPVCRGDGIDRNRWLTLCACARWFDKSGKEYTEFEADKLSCEKYGMKQRMTEAEWKQKRGIA